MHCSDGLGHRTTAYATHAAIHGDVIDAPIARAFLPGHDGRPGRRKEADAG
jgi:hypothetical protein